MSLFSDLIASGKIRDRDTLRRVYRRLVKRLHPDSAPKGEATAVEAKPKAFVDFDNLKRDLAEAERLLLELGSTRPEDEGGIGAEARRSDATSTKPQPAPPPRKAHDGASAKRAVFNRGILIAELRDLVARGLPVNLRAASRNRAYRDCVATVSAELALLSGDQERFARIDAQMRTVKYGSLRLHYYVMQVFWNGLDWASLGLPWSRDTALRDFGVIRDNLGELGLVELEALLAWIIEAERPLSQASRAAVHKR